MNPPSIVVVETVAGKEGVSPNDLDCILADAIDPDALNTVIESFSLDGPADDQNDGSFVQFSYCGYLVTVWADGTVEAEVE